MNNNDLAEGLIDRESQPNINENQGKIHSTPGQTRATPSQQRTILNINKETLEKTPRWNINVTSAYLHVLGDLLMSVGVIIASVIIYFKPEWRIADPLCTFLFSIIVVFTTIPVIKECTFVLLEGSPDSIDVEDLTADLLNI